MFNDERTRRLLHKATSDMIVACARCGVRGLDIFGMLAAASAAQFEVVRAACNGIEDKYMLAPEPRDLDLLAHYRTAVERMLEINHHAMLDQIDEAIARVLKSSGAHDRTPAPAPSVAQVEAMYNLKERT